MGNTATNSMVGTSDDRAGADRSAKSPSTATRLIHVIAACSAVLMCVIVAGTVTVIVNLRAQAFADTERELRNMALVLAEQIDRSFEAVGLVEASLIERMNRIGVVSTDKLRSEMAGYDAHLMLKDMINGLPHIESLAVVDTRGTIVNFTGAWPVPYLTIADRTYYKVLMSNRNVTSILSEPIHKKHHRNLVDLSRAKILRPERRPARHYQRRNGATISRALFQHDQSRAWELHNAVSTRRCAACGPSAQARA